jgi:hypothetical protein
MTAEEMSTVTHKTVQGSIFDHRHRFPGRVTKAQAQEDYKRMSETVWPASLKRTKMRSKL